MFRKAGSLVLCLPPYSPDFKLAENTFSKVKYYLTEDNEIFQAVSDPIPIIKVAPDRATRQNFKVPLPWLRGHNGNELCIVIMCTV